MATTKPDDKASASVAPKPRRVIDVTEPGKTAPTPSSKPIIVTNRPMLKQDPMVLTPDGIEKDKPREEITLVPRAIKTLKAKPMQPAAADAPDVASGGGAESVVPAPAGKKIALEVGTEAVEAAEKEAAEPDDSSAIPKPDDTAPENASDDMKLDPPDEPESAEAKSEEAAASATPIPAAQTSVPDEDKETTDGDSQLAPNQAVDQAKRKDEDAKLTRLAEEEKIIASKQFYLPINGVEKQRRSLDRVLLALVFVILLALIWLDVVLDAGIIKVGGIQPLTHFFQP